MRKPIFSTIDEYISTFPMNVQDILGKVRKTIKEAVPEAEETISYQIPAFKLPPKADEPSAQNGKYLVYFAGWKKHISIYPVSAQMEKSIKGLSLYKTSGKGSVQFPLDKPIPLPLIKKIVKYMVKENSKRIKKKE